MGQSRRCMALRRLYCFPAMKTTLLRLLTNTAFAVFLVATAAPLRAQAERKDKAEEKDESSDEEDAPLPRVDPEELKKLNKERTKKEEEEIRKMLKVFK